MREANLSGFVSSESTFGGFLTFGAGFEFSEISMVIALHFEVKHLGISGCGGGNESRIKKFEDSITNIRELSFNFGSVVTDHRDMVIVASAFLLLFDGGNDTPGSPTSADDVLVGDGKEISLLDGEFLLVDGSGNFLHELDHLLVALGLLGKLGHVNMLLAKRGGGGHCRGERRLDLRAAAAAVVVVWDQRRKGRRRGRRRVEEVGF